MRCDERAHEASLVTVTEACKCWGAHARNYTSHIINYMSYAHREIFSKSYQIKPKSDSIYHFSIQLEPNGRPFAVPNQSENGIYNLISV